MNRCAFGGVLVSAEQLLPKHDFDFGWVDADIPIGCNRLRCSVCGEWVRTAPRMALQQAGVGHASEIYDTADWQTLVAKKWMQNQDWGRFYLCRCNGVMEDHDFRAPSDENEWEMQWQPTWSCDGHPELELPVELDGEMLTDTTRWDELVARRFAGSVPELEEPAWKDVWLCRAYHLLEHTRHGDVLSRAVAAQLEAESPRARMEAIDFFRQTPESLGAERLVELLSQRSELFDGVANPFGPEDLRWHALQALAKQVRRGSDVALSTARAQLLKPGKKPGFLVEVMRVNDGAWLNANQDQIDV